MKKFAALSLSAVFCLAVAGCAGDVNDTKKVLENKGYTDVAVGGYDPWAGFRHPLLCSKNKMNNTFTAKAPSGARVSGVVCNQIFFKSIALD